MRARAEKGDPKEYAIQRGVGRRGQGTKRHQRETRKKREERKKKSTLREVRSNGDGEGTRGAWVYLMSAQNAETEVRARTSTPKLQEREVKAAQRRRKNELRIARASSEGEHTRTQKSPLVTCPQHQQDAAAGSREYGSNTDNHMDRG